MKSMKVFVVAVTLFAMAGLMTGADASNRGRRISGATRVTAT